MATPFRFYTRLNLTEFLGRKAADLKEFLEGLKSVPGSSIYYHTRRFPQQHYFLSPGHPNDFAHWISMSLKDDRLGEKLAAAVAKMGPYTRTLENLRQRIRSLIKDKIRCRRVVIYAES